MKLDIFLFYIDEIKKRIMSTRKSAAPDSASFLLTVFPVCGNDGFSCRQLSKHDTHLSMRVVFFTCVVNVISQALAYLT